MANETKTYELVAEPREITGKASRKVRRAGMLPAVVYGHNVTSQSLQVPKKEFEQVYLRAGSNTLVDLKVGDGEPARKVFIHDVQRTAVSHDLTHVDFLVVNLREEMTASVPVVLVGESPVVQNNEGVLIHQTEYIQIKALPTDIPPSIEVDISVLDEIGKSIHVSDLKLPENVTLLTPEDDLIARVNELRITAEEVAEEEAAEAEREEAAEAAEAEAEAGTSEDES
ncbi:MAG: 50S ribosomal protein L25 [Chloroflexota bacterium]